MQWRTLGFAMALAVSPCAWSQSPPWDACFDKAGALFGIHPALLRAIARQESSMRPDALNKATYNGSVDTGVMQINSGWWPTLRENGIDPESLKDPCTNIAVGTWILARAVQRHGMDWKAVGAYHSPTPARQEAYAAKIRNHLVAELAKPPVLAVGANGSTATESQVPRVGLTASEELALIEARHSAPKGD